MFVRSGAPYNEKNVEMYARSGNDEQSSRGACSKETHMPYAYILTATIPASPREIYEAWLDSIGHSEMTGSEATMSDEVGAEVSAWDGYISGRNLELVPGERIVQSWRTTEFADEDDDSVITVLLQEVEEGTLLTIEHSNVPDEQRSYEEGGWQSSYFEPMTVYFTEIKGAERKEDVAEPPSYQASPRSVGDEESAPPTATRRPRKRAGAARRTARTGKPKQKATTAKIPPKKSKSRHAAKARSATAPKRSRSATSKSVKRKSAARKSVTRKSATHKSARGRRR